MSKLPAAVYWCITVIVIAVVGSLTYLAAIGADSAEVSRFINTLLNASGLLLGGLGAVGGTVAAVNSRKAVEQTNGGLDKRIKAGARAALAEHEAESTGEIKP